MFEVGGKEIKRFSTCCSERSEVCRYWEILVNLTARLKHLIVADLIARLKHLIVADLIARLKHLIVEDLIARLKHLIVADLIARLKHLIVADLIARLKHLIVADLIARLKHLIVADLIAPLKHLIVADRDGGWEAVQGLLPISREYKLLQIRFMVSRENASPSKRAPRSLPEIHRGKVCCTKLIREFQSSTHMVIFSMLPGVTFQSNKIKNFISLTLSPNMKLEQTLRSLKVVSLDKFQWKNT